MIRTIFSFMTAGLVMTGFLMAEALTAGVGGAQDKGIKDDVKDAANATGRAAKKTGSKIKRGTKKAVNKSAEATEKAADKVKEKTR